MHCKMKSKDLEGRHVAGIRESDRKYFYSKHSNAKPKIAKGAEPPEGFETVRPFQSTNNSPLTNKTLTPKLKAFGLSGGTLSSSSTGKGMKRWNTNVNTFQQRMQQVGSPDKSPPKPPTAEAKVFRASNKEVSANTQKKDAKSKRAQKSKKPVGKFESIQAAGPAKKSPDNKENQSPNTKAVKSRSQKTKTSPQLKNSMIDSPKYQMFSKFLKSMESIQESEASPAPVRTVATEGTKHQRKETAIGTLPQKLAVSEDIGKTLLSIATVIGQIWMNFQTDEDYYDTIREYVDVAQDQEFKAVYQAFSGRSSSQKLYGDSLLSMKLERWVVMTVFYFIFATKATKAKMRNLLKDMLYLVLQNATCVNKLLVCETPAGDKLEASKRIIIKAVFGKEADLLSLPLIEELVRANCKKIIDKLSEW